MAAASKHGGTGWPLSAWIWLSLLGAAASTALALSLVAQRSGRAHELQQAATSLTQLGWQLREQLDRDAAARLGAIRALAESRLMNSLAEPQRVRNALQALQRETPLCAWIGVADRNGRVLAATGGLLEGADVSARPWFQAGLHGPVAGVVHGSLALEQRLPQQDGPRPFAELAAPVVVGGITHAVVGAYLSWEWARDIERRLLAPVLRSQGLQTFIVQDGGRVLLGPAGMEGKLLGVAALAAAAEAHGGAVVWPGEGEFVTAVIAAKGQNGDEGLGWTVIVRQAPEMALARRAALHNPLIAAAAAMMLLMAAGAALVSRQLSAPLAQLTNSLRELKAPEGLSLQGRCYREAHSLLKALQSMCGRHQRQLDEMEKASAVLARRTQERTRQLERSRKLLQFVGDNLSALVALIDPELRFRFANEAHRQWWDVDPCSLIGQGLQQLLGEQNFEMLHPQIEQALRGQRVTSELYMSFGKRQRYVEVTCVPQHDEEGHLDGFMVLVYDVTARKQLELRLQREANHDALTGLPNRRNFVDLLALAMLRTQRIGSPLALVLLDLDAFKALNDVHGRDAGDAVLLAVAQRLRRCVRRTDTVARMGSDRFAVLLECMAGAADAVHVIRKIHAALAQPVELPGGVPVCVAARTCSVPYTGNRSVGAEMLLFQADAAMYESGQGARAPKQASTEKELA